MNRYFILAVSFAVVLTGCKDPNDELLDLPTGSSKKSNAEYTPSAVAGIRKDLTKSQDPNRLKGLIASTSRFGRRQNPFALSADELSFDKSQASEKFLAEDGNFGTRFELPEDKEPTVVAMEPQPYRRLSGIVIGDAVYALLEENGVTTIIRPGMRIPNSSWRVASIDRDKAVFVRDGNTLPKEIEVRLEVAPPGFGSGGGGAVGGGAAGGGGRAGGGRAGGGPAGFSGA
jgi:uncharacterized membrane protein YgcG